MWADICYVLERFIDLLLNCSVLLLLLLLVLLNCFFVFANSASPFSHDVVERSFAHARLGKWYLPANGSGNERSHGVCVGGGGGGGGRGEGRGEIASVSATTGKGEGHVSSKLSLTTS